MFNNLTTMYMYIH